MHDETDEFLAYNTARGYLYVISKNLVFSISGFIFYMFIARFLPSISDLGLVYALQFLIYLVAIFAGLGLPTAVTRFMSYYIGAGRKDMAKGICILVFRIGIAFFHHIFFYTVYLSRLPCYYSFPQCRLCSFNSDYINRYYLIQYDSLFNLYSIFFARIQKSSYSLTT